ncbi:Hpt domain-containing protein [Dyadobacter sp. CY312]|uniref:Hpt domain-containing protein n=1 Tax=Dyadobacter sp. CY312 TaxID=2907303 RepID=UPI001F15DCF2|nr:Hpt domain-containing protein [Dyadobacter sp. CY312]MCE7041470.1 Hpt domain-containing protein [Dyadobacter sp. CY312]
MDLQINPALDIKYLNQVYGEDSSIIHLIFDAFLSDSMPRWHSLKTALEEGNYEESASIVHGLKPSFTMAGLTAIRPKVEKLETAIKEGVEVSKLIVTYQHISDELLPLIPIIESESSRLAAL